MQGFDVVVVGAGRAGCEAALAAATPVAMSKLGVGGHRAQATASG